MSFSHQLWFLVHWKRWRLWWSAKQCTAGKGVVPSSAGGVGWPSLWRITWYFIMLQQETVSVFLVFFLITTGLSSHVLDQVFVFDSHSAETTTNGIENTRSTLCMEMDDDLPSVYINWLNEHTHYVTMSINYMNSHRNSNPSALADMIFVVLFYHGYYPADNMLRGDYMTRFGNSILYYNFLMNSLKFIKVYIIRKGISQGRQSWYYFLTKNQHFWENHKKHVFCHFSFKTGYKKIEILKIASELFYWLKTSI